MTTRDRDESAYRHYTRVRIGITGPQGRLMRCAKKDGSGHYWKVRLDTGEWMWPADLILDGPGDRVAACAECGMRFMTTEPAVLCPGCDEKLFGTQQRAEEPDDIQGMRNRGPYRRR